MEKLIIGVSLPRSGSNFLAGLLVDISGPRLAYGSWPPNRENVPAEVALFARTHDEPRTQEIPRPEVFYLIQHREPRGRVLSEAQRHAKRSEAVRAAFMSGDREFSARWLESQENRTVAFYNKWLAAPPPRSLVVDYRRLRANPLTVLSDLLLGIGIEESDARIRSTCERLGGLRASSKSPFRPRALEASPFIPLDMLAEHVEAVLNLCPVWRDESCTARLPST